MEHENTTQETPRNSDPAQLCEHCPFAPQNGEGTGQESAQETALNAPQHERRKIQGGQETAPSLEDALNAHEEDAHEGEKLSALRAFDEAVQRIAMAYLADDSGGPLNATQSNGDRAQLDAPERKAEQEHRRQRREAEEAQSESASEMPDLGGDAKQKDTAHRDGQHRAQYPSRRSSKTVQATDRERA